MAQRHTGRNTVIAMGVMFSAFGAFYYTLHINHQKKKVSGKLPQFEYTIADQAKYRGDSPSFTAERRFAPVIREHNHQHFARDSPEVSTPGRYLQVPSPQRPKGDGSGLVYTKRLGYKEGKSVENPKQ